jgi:hypothetical protein
LGPHAVIEIFLYSGVLPAALALTTYFAGGWLPGDVRSRYRLAASFAVAVFGSFALAPTTKSLAPTQFWDWIPYLALLSAGSAGLAEAGGVTRLERWLTYFAAAGAAAYSLAPTWDDLAVPRWGIVALLAGSITATAIALAALASRLPGRGLPLWLALAAAALAALMMAEISETFGRLAAAPAGALGGCAVVSFLRGNVQEVRALALPYSVVVGGYAFTGFIYPTVPLTALLAVPLVPLLLWVMFHGPPARLTGARAMAAQAGCILLPLIVIAAVIVARSGGNGW